MVSSPARKPTTTTGSRRLSTRSRSDIIKSDLAKGRRSRQQKETGTKEVAGTIQASDQSPAWKVIPSTNGQSFAITSMDAKERSRPPCTFEKVFTGDCDTQTVYNAVVRNVVVSACSTGFNGAVFAYGQTSSGKTHTMQGSGTIREATAQGGGAAGGILHFAAKDIFDHIEENTERSFSVRVRCIEIHNENVYDLLATERKVLRIIGDLKDGVKIPNVKDEVVINCAGLLEVLSRAETNRSFAATAMNSRSSRSHTIFSITIESWITGSGVSAVRRATLNLVDLAGSESVRHTKAKGARKQEGGLINKRQVKIGNITRIFGSQNPILLCSLLALSKVFIARSSTEETVSFRESKLTRLLQPSLDGNAQIAMICCVTPSRPYMDETGSTLSFAARAKHVKNNPQINELRDALPGERLRIVEAQNVLLQKELKMARERVRQLEFSLRLTESNSRSGKRQRHSFDFATCSTQSTREMDHCPRAWPSSSLFREKEGEISRPLDRDNACQRSFGVHQSYHSFPASESASPNQTNDAKHAEDTASLYSKSPVPEVVEREIACFVSGNYNAVQDNDVITKEVSEAVASFQSETFDRLGGRVDALKLFGETPHKCGRCSPDDHALFTHYGTVFQASTIVPLTWCTNVDKFWKKLGNMEVSDVLENSMDQSEARAKELFKYYFDLSVEAIEAATRRLVPSNDARVRSEFNVLHTCQCCGAAFLSQPLYRGHQYAWNGECPTLHCIDPRNLLGWSIDTVIALVLHNTVGDDDGRHHDRLPLLDTRIAPDMVDKSSAEYRFESLMIVDQLVGIEDSCNDTTSERGRNDTLFRIMARKLMYVCDSDQRPATRNAKMEVIFSGGKGGNVRLVRIPFLLPFHYWPPRYKVRVEYWVRKWSIN